MTRTLLATAVALALGAPAHAELCRYEDDQGHVTYSDTMVKGARKVGCLGAPPPPPPAARPDPAETAARPAPAGRSAAADARRGELRERLGAEEERLRVARDELAQQEAVRHGDERNYQRVLDRLKPYQDAVQQAQQAVEATRAELSGMR
ncbi:MAG: DUF4124 domain-containing protein [Burkholderiales bacterium]|nr:DUF4124 domain-containing protein [Burkholderiales bacterium]